MVEKHRMHRLAQTIVAAEGKRQVAHSAAHLGSRQIALDPLHGPYEVKSIAVMLLDAGGDGEYVGVKDYVLGRKLCLLREQTVGPATHLDFSFIRVGLTLLVKCHDHHGRPETAYAARTLHKCLFALFERYGVDYTLALHTFEAALYHFPF